MIERRAHGGESLALLAHPSFQIVDERFCSLNSDSYALPAERPLISRSMANSASMRLTASMAIGAFCSSASANSLRRPCAQDAASMIGPGLRPVT